MPTQIAASASDETAEPVPPVKTPANVSQEEADLSSVFEKIEKDVAAAFWQAPDAFWGFMALILVTIVSPLVVFWVCGASNGKDWSETVKNVVEALALVAAAFGVCKWLDERRNRATDVLLALNQEFNKPGVVAGRTFIEKSDYVAGTQPEQLDEMLRFYVVLYGVFRARQVPEVSLSICFRYWLAHYFRSDRRQFRTYIDENYPTLSGWLKKDCCNGLPFFRPDRIFGNAVDDEFIECLKK